MLLNNFSMDLESIRRQISFVMKFIVLNHLNIALANSGPLSSLLLLKFQMLTYVFTST